MRTKRFLRPRRLQLRAAAVSVLFLGTAVAGCSAAASSSNAGSGAAAASGPVMAAAPSASSSAASGAGGAALSGSGYSGQAQAAVKYAAAQIIYTAELSVRAANVSAAVSQATSIVSAAGGYVSSENASAGNGKPSQATATVTFKIPAALYAPTLAELSGKGLGTQLSLQQQAQDVTQQVADVSSRVTSDEAAIAQLRALLKDAGSVDNLLNVQDQINSEESDLESMQAQQKALSQETSFATVTLSLVGPAVVVKPQSPAKAAPPPGFARALSGGGHALHVAVGWLLTILGAVAPFAAVLAVAGGLYWWTRRRLLLPRRRPRSEPGDDVKPV